MTDETLCLHDYTSEKYSDQDVSIQFFFFVKKNTGNTVDLLCILYKVVSHLEMTSQFLWRVSRFTADENGRILSVIFVKLCDGQTFLLEASMNIVPREFFKF